MKIADEKNPIPAIVMNFHLKSGTMKNKIKAVAINNPKSNV